MTERETEKEKHRERQRKRNRERDRERETERETERKRESWKHEREKSKPLSTRGSLTDYASAVVSPPSPAQAVVSVRAPAPVSSIGATKGKALVCYTLLIFMNCVS